MNKSILAISIFSTFFALNATAGKLTIETNNNAVSITAGQNNTLVVNGNEISNSKFVIDDSGKVVGKFAGFTDATNSASHVDITNISMGQGFRTTDHGYQLIVVRNVFTGNYLIADSDIVPMAVKTLLADINIGGKSYPVNIDRAGYIPSSRMIYSDSSCSQAKYVIASTIPNGGWNRNTIITDWNAKGVYVATQPVINEDAYNQESHYAYVTVHPEHNYLDPQPAPEPYVVCKLIDKGLRIGYDVDYINVEPLATSGIVEIKEYTEEEQKESGAKFDYRLSNVSGSISIK